MASDISKTPPTGNPKDCICGGKTSTNGIRYAVVCPCCDGEVVVTEIPNAKPEDVQLVPLATNLAKLL